MIRPVALLLGLALILAAVAAGDRPVRSPAAQRLQQLERNRQLIRVLVDNSLRLAAERDALKRADCCNEVARRLAGEVRQAADDRDDDRAVELGQHLCALASRGVFGSLSAVRKRTPAGSAREVEMRRVGDHLAEATQSLDDLGADLPRTGREDLRKVLDDLAEVRRQVEQVLKAAPVAAD